MIDSDLPLGARYEALRRFREDPSFFVLLLTTVANHSGLTLTSANHCILLDLPVNAQDEKQIIGRIHRIGQTRPTTVTKLIQKSSVESRLNQLRDSIFSSTVNRPYADSCLKTYSKIRSLRRFKA